jgi:hypothetical protein
MLYGARLHVRDLQIGDVFYETDPEFPGWEVEAVVETAPVFDGHDQWTFTGRPADGTAVEYLMVDGLEHYAPRLTRVPLLSPRAEPAV